MYKIDQEKCIGCGMCVSVCPHGAIKIAADGKAIIDQNKCQNCGKCVSICPIKVIKSVK